MRVAGTSASTPHVLEVAAAALAAFCSLCAFTSPHHREVLASVKHLCTLEGAMAWALGKSGVLQRAEQMLPGAPATFMLTSVEAHLVPCGPESGRRSAASHVLPMEERALMSDQGPQLGYLPESLWPVLMRLMPLGATYTVALSYSRPRAIVKKCLLATLLRKTAANHQAHLAVPSVLKPAAELALQLEQQLIQQQHQQHQQQLQKQEQHHCPDLASALGNCLVFFKLGVSFDLCGPIIMALVSRADHPVQQLLQLHSRSVQRVARAPLDAARPWSLVCSVGGELAIEAFFLLREVDPARFEADNADVGRCSDALASIHQYLHKVGQLHGHDSLPPAQRVALAHSLLAISTSALSFAPLPEQLAQAPPDVLCKQLTFSNASMLALAMVQRELLHFLAAEGNACMLSTLLSPAFLAQHNWDASLFSADAMLTWRALLTARVAHCSHRLDETVRITLLEGSIGSSVPAQLDLLALLAALAAWPLGAAQANAAEVAALQPFTRACWLAAQRLVDTLELRKAAPDRTLPKSGPHA